MDAEVNELERKPYLTQEEQGRLGKLRLEQEFQRRVQEMEGKDDDADDSDTDLTERASVSTRRDFFPACIFKKVWFPRGLENLEKLENFFQSGNFEKTGKVGEFYSKYWKNEGILASFYFFSLIF